MLTESGVVQHKQDITKFIQDLKVFLYLCLQMDLYMKALLDVVHVLWCYFHFRILRIGRFRLAQLESEPTVSVVKLQKLYLVWN